MSRRLAMLRRFRFWSLLVAMALVGGPAALRGAEGLDFVLLVDVSGSNQNYKHPVTNTDRKGSDCARLRWDSVKIVLDLLTDDDRILVLPFNATCPATHQDPGRDPIPVPGKLRDELLTAGPEYQDELGSRLLSFIHNDNPDRRAWPQEFNGDTGGTGILRALGTAGEKIAAAHGAESGRQTVVVLLTDGAELTSKDGQSDPDEQLVNGGRWRDDPRIRFFCDRKIVLHTIGLGPDAGLEFLTNLGTLTEGSATFAKTNLELVEKFRDLVWSHRECWTAHIEPQAFKAGDLCITSGPLRNVRDLGILIYEDDPVSRNLGQPRTAFVPSPLPNLRWRGVGAASPPKLPKPRTGKRIPTVTVGGGPGPERDSGYAYYYFDGRLRPEGERGELFQQSPTLEAELIFPESQRDREIRGYFIKRGQRFTIALAGNRFFRHQPIPLRVVMVNPKAAAQDYRVIAELLPAETLRDTAGAASGSEGGVVRTEMVPISTTEFACGPDFTAEGIPSPSRYQAPVESCLLRVLIEERNPASRSLTPYRHTLPLRSIEIENLLPIKRNEPVLLNRSQWAADVWVQPVYAPQKPLPLRLEYVPPLHKGSDTPLTTDQLRWGSKPPPSETNEVSIVDGWLGLRLQLLLSKVQPGDYVGGRLKLTRGDNTVAIRTEGVPGASDADNAHTVPFEVHLGPVGIRLAGAGAANRLRELRVGPTRAVDTQPVTVKLAKAGTSTAGVGPPEVEIIQSNDTAAVFSATELFLRRAGGADAAQTLTTTFEEPLEIVFQPDPTKHADPAVLIGTHGCQLRAKGPGFDEIRQSLSLVVEPVQWDVNLAKEQDRRGHPGSVLPPIRHQVRVRWLPGVPLAHTLEPADGTVPLRGENGQLYAVPYRGAASPVTLTTIAETADMPADAGWHDLAFTLELPGADRVGFGPLKGAVLLAFRGQTRATLPFAVTVDGIYTVAPVVAAETAKPFTEWVEIRPTRRTVIPLRQYFDRPRVITLGVRSELDYDLDPARLKVEFVGPRLPDGRGPFLMKTAGGGAGNHRDYLKPPATPDPARDIRKEPQGRGLLVDFRFPPVVSALADPEPPYRLEAALQYADEAAGVDLGETRVTLELRLIDAHGMVQTAAEAP